MNLLELRSLSLQEIDDLRTITTIRDDLTAFEHREGSA